MATLTDVINNLFQAIIDTVAALLGGPAGQFVVALIALGFLFWLVQVIRAGSRRT